MTVERRITPAQLAELVELDPKAGSLTWRRRGPQWFAHLGADANRAMASWNTKNAGRPAFAYRSGNGYLHGALMDEKVLAHRVVWALWAGAWPVATIDHINGDRRDNRPENLRDVPHVQNCRNQPLRKGNTSGVTGVHIDRRCGKYSAAVSVDGRTVHLGRFDTMAEAVAARQAANAQHGFHQNHGRKTA